MRTHWKLNAYANRGSLVLVFWSSCAGSARSTAEPPVVGHTGCFTTRPPTGGREMLAAYGDLCTIDNRPRRLGPHRGLDISARLGEIVYASAEGKVVYSSFSSSIGWDTIIFYESAAVYVRYVHLWDSLALGHVVEGESTIGHVGIFQASAGVSHLHLEVCTDAYCVKTIDPFPLLSTCECVDCGVLRLPLSCPFIVVEAADASRVPSNLLGPPFRRRSTW